MSCLLMLMIQRRRCANRCGEVLLRAAAFAIGLLLFTSGAGVTAAPVGYVYYFRSFGQWTVICGRDDAARHDNCTLSAPPPEMHGAESQIEISHGPSGNAAVSLRVRGALMPSAPFYLRVDAKPPHQTMPNRFGEGGWSGPEAQTIIDELNAGQQVVVRWFVGPPPSPRDELFSLDGFDEAMANLAEKTGKGPMSESMPPPEPADVGADAKAAAGAGSTAAAAGAERQPAPSATQEAERQPAEPAPAPTAEPAPAPTAEPAPATEPAQPPSSRPSGEPAEVGDTVKILNAHIGRAQLTTNIANREPVDALSSPVQVKGAGTDAIYFFTEVVDLAGKTVTHRWEHGGNVLASVPFRIGGDRWRVYSRKTVGGAQSGPWTVTATGPDGTVLARATFVVE
jgi:hypothetical protein